MEKARYNTELYSNLRAHLNNVKPSNFWGSHQLISRPLRAPPGSYIKPDYPFVTKFTNLFTHLNSKKCKKVKKSPINL